MGQPSAKVIANELLHTYCDALFFASELSKYETVESPECYFLFEMVFDLLGIPSRDQCHRMRIPHPKKAGVYITRDSLIQEFHGIYDDPNVDDSDYIKVYLEFLESLSQNRELMSGDVPLLPAAHDN